MFAQKSQISAKTGSETYPLGQPREPLFDAQSMALVTLSHTPVEHLLYTSMLAETAAQGMRISRFNTKQLMTLTSIRSAGTVRRGLEGLIVKLSIERRGNGKNGNGEASHQYFVREPREILAQRNAMGVSAFPCTGVIDGNQYLERALTRVLANNNLSRREAQVALCCVEGLTNAEIGNRLSVSEQTVKFHLRHVFIKFSVRRRAELIARLLM